MLVVLLNLACLFFRQRHRAWSFDLYDHMTRLWEPFHGSEIVLKLTDGLKNKLEAFCGTLISSVSCPSHTDSAIRIDQPEMMIDVWSILVTLMTL